MLKSYKKKWDQSSDYSRDVIFVVERSGFLTGFKGYFVAKLANNVLLDISGDDIGARTSSDSWKHAFLPIQEPIPVKFSDSLHLNFPRFYPPESNSYFRQIYRWQGFVKRNSEVVGHFDQCLDEKALQHHHTLSQPSMA